MNSLHPALIDHIEYLLCIKVLNVRHLSGGDTSLAYLLESASERFFCKINESDQAHAMFRTEQNGLSRIAETKTIAVPRVYHCETTENGAFLLMEYIENKTPDKADRERLGHHLATMHQHSSSNTFGAPEPNFIGKLPQTNVQNSDWPTFYAEERLLPQLRSALDNALMSPSELPSEAKVIAVCSALLPNPEPALLHGDLWSGNFLVDLNGNPYLIDPSCYYGHAAVDLAMTRLFGGFGPPFYEAYRHHLPQKDVDDKQEALYQLYYLLVHLNLFGRSYRNQVLTILQHHF